MRCLVTGATSRQANPVASDPNKKEVAFAFLLAEALRDAGHEVEHRNPTVLESYDDFDHVFVGLAPLHGLGSNRAYGVLACVLKTWASGRLSLFADDPDVGKVTGGLRTMVSNPGNLTKPFFAYKLESAVAHQPEYAEWLQSGVEILNEQQWPRLIIPAHSWFNDYDSLLKAVPQAQGVVTPVDLTAYLPEAPVKEFDERLPEWVCESPSDNKWLRQQQPSAPVYRIGTAKDGGKKKLPDVQLVNLYRRAIGVLQPPIKPPGWWVSRMGYAAQAGTPYVTRWQDVQHLGASYSVLPYAVAEMSYERRRILAAEQSLALTAASATREQLKEQLTQIVSAKTEVSA